MPQSKQKGSLIADVEERALKARSTQTKFKQQVFLGMGGAMVFGLVASIGGKLLGMLGTGVSAAPLLGLIGIAALGLGCIYIGSRFMADAISFDQDMQARKIEIARAKHQEVDLTPEIEANAPTSMPLGLQSAQPDRTASTTPDTAIQHAALQGRVSAPQLAESRA